MAGSGRDLNAKPLGLNRVIQRQAFLQQKQPPNRLWLRKQAGWGLVKQNEIWQFPDATRNSLCGCQQITANEFFGREGFGLVARRS